MKVLSIAITLCCLLCTTPLYAEEITAEKKEAIKELLEVTGAAQMGEMFGKAFSRQMLQVLKESGVTIDPKVSGILQEESDAMMHEELIVKQSLLPYMYPVYDKYLTVEEMHGLIQFYKTPLGQKAVSVLPKMTREAMQAGQEWGQKIIPQFQQKVYERLEKEGITVEK